MNKKTITIAVLSCNTEKDIEDAVKEVLKAVKGKFDDYEIIISDSGSTDKTLEIADKLALKNNKIKVLRLKRVGIGYGYKGALKISTMNYFTMFPGDNENVGEDFEKTLKIVGKADIIIPYTTNQEIRAIHRRFISKLFVVFLNLIFGFNLKYFNGTCIYKTDSLRKIKINANDFAYSAEALIKLLKLGNSYIEIGIKIKPSDSTTIFKFKNMFGIVKTILYLIYEIKIKDRKKYNSLPKKIN